MIRYIMSILLVLLIFYSGVAYAQETCCVRYSIFLRFAVPEGEERDVSGNLDAALYSALREEDILDCPIEWCALSFRGREILEWMINEIGRIEGAPQDTLAKRQIEEFMDCDYVWQTTLDLLNLEEVIPGESVVGYAGEPDYEQGYIFGDWYLHVQLLNVQFNELVKEGSIFFSGSAVGDGGEAMKSLVRSTFNPVDDLVYNYERIPMNCEIGLENDSIEAGEEVTITLKDIKDDKGRPSKEWQRIVVEVEEGRVLNGVLCSDEEKKYAFLVNGGTVAVEYKAPQKCEDATETFTIYNSCQWGQEWVRPMRTTDSKKQLAQKKVKVYDRLPERCNIIPAKREIEAGTSMNVKITDIVDGMNKSMQPAERLMVKAGKGKILNGMDYGEYKIFEVGSGIIDAYYRAPDDCDIKSDIIRVYSCCVKGDTLVEIVPQKEIRNKKIDIKCTWTWVGKLTIDASETFQCEIEPTEENDWRQLSEHNFHTQKAEIDLMIEDIQVGEMAADVRIGGDMEVSGNIMCMLSKSREFSVRPPYDICVKEPKRRSPGSWIYDKKTFNGHSSRPINMENLGLTIAKDITDNTEKLKELSEEMKSAGTDISRLTELQGQMQRLLMGGGNDNNKLKVQVLLNAEVRDQVLTTVFHQSHDACLAKTETDEDDESTVEMPLGGIFNIIMDGTFTEDKYGINQITASFDSTATKTVDKGYGICEKDKITTLKCRLDLNKRSKKN